MVEKNKNLEEILSFNKKFVEDKEYEVFGTTKYPDKKMVVVSCMDTRLTELLPKAMNVRNGDAKFIKNAGGVIVHPFGSAMRSIIVCVYEFDVKEVYIVGHFHCGMSGIDPSKTIQKMLDRGISKNTIDTLSNAGIKVNKWLYGFDSVEISLIESVEKVRNHPLMPKDVAVHGLLIDPKTGALFLRINGWDAVEAYKESLKEQENH